MTHDPHFGQPVLATGAPLGEGAGVVVMLHGRGAGPRDILAVAPVLDRPALTYLAPSAANHTWYPHSFLTEMPENEPFLTSALRVVHDLIESITKRGIPRERIALLGFSQGACLACETTIRHAGRYGAVIAFSGGAIGPPGTSWTYPGSFDGTPVFLGCSDVDAHIPKARVEETADIFDRMGAHVDKRIYPGMGHLVNEDEIDAARAILDRLI